MFENEDITDTEFDKILEHVDLGELNVVESHSDRKDMSEEVLGVVVVPVADMLSIHVGQQWHTREGRYGKPHLGMCLC